MTLPDHFDLSRRRDVAAAAVRSAAREPSVLHPHTRTGATTTVVERDSDPISSIRAVIHAAFPNERTLGQVSGLDVETGWAVSAFDSRSGNAFPAFGPAVAWISSGHAMACAVQMPTFDETFSAARGQGASLNGKLLRVVPHRDLERAFILSTHLEVTMPSIGEVVTRLAGWRMPSPHGRVLALLCYLATGRIDGFVARADAGGELEAGRLLVEEAGGVVSTQNGSEPDSRGALFAAASSADLLNQMLQRAEFTKA